MGDIFHYIQIVGRVKSENEFLGLFLTFRPKGGNYDAIQTFPMMRPVSSAGGFVWNSAQGRYLHYNETPYNLELNRWYHMKATFQEDTFTFYVDGAFATSFTSAAIPTGGVGIGIGGVVGHFDNVVITGPVL